MRSPCIYPFANTIINQTFNTIFTHISKLLQHSHIYTTYNMETHPDENHKVLFIWHEEIVAPFVCRQSYGLCSRSHLLYLQTFPPLMLSDLLSFSSYSTPTSNLHATWIYSTFPTCMCTQLQNLYSDALNDIESLTKTLPPFQLKRLSKSLYITQLLYQLIC